MMGGVSPETCSASYEYGIIKKFDTLLHLVGFLCMNCNFIILCLSTLCTLECQYYSV